MADISPDENRVSPAGSTSVAERRFWDLVEQYAPVDEGVVRQSQNPIG